MTNMRLLLGACALVGGDVLPPVEMSLEQLLDERRALIAALQRARAALAGSVTPAQIAAWAEVEDALRLAENGR